MQMQAYASETKKNIKFIMVNRVNIQNNRIFFIDYLKKGTHIVRRKEPRNGKYRGDEKS